MPTNKPSLISIIGQHEEEDAYLNSIVNIVVALLAEQVQTCHGRDRIPVKWKQIDDLLLKFKQVDVETAKRQQAVDELLDLERSLNR